MSGSSWLRNDEIIDRTVQEPHAPEPERTGWVGKAAPELPPAEVLTVETDADGNVVLRSSLPDTSLIVERDETGAITVRTRA